MRDNTCIECAYDPNDETQLECLAYSCPEAADGEPNQVWDSDLD